MKATVTAHKEEPLNISFAHGKKVELQAGAVGEFDLTGDEIGYVRGTLDAQSADRLIRGTGGGVKAPEVDDSKPPYGSKVHRRLHPEIYQETVTAAKASPAKAVVRGKGKTDEE